MGLAPSLFVPDVTLARVMQPRGTDAGSRATIARVLPEPEALAGQENAHEPKLDATPDAPGPTFFDGNLLSARQSRL
ncbi:MAG: hypothetical protein AAB011_01905 [Candidatus Eisenbacteria bacterium]